MNNETNEPVPESVDNKGKVPKDEVVEQSGVKTIDVEAIDYQNDSPEKKQAKDQLKPHFEQLMSILEENGFEDINGIPVQEIYETIKKGFEDTSYFAPGNSTQIDNGITKVEEYIQSITIMEKKLFSNEEVLALLEASDGEQDEAKFKVKQNLAANVIKRKLNIISDELSRLAMKN